MPDNNPKDNSSSFDKEDAIKAVIISLAAMIFFLILFSLTEKDDDVIFTINTLSEEELAGETYTERTAFDDSDMWETAVPVNTEITNEIMVSFAESEANIEFPIDINLANTEELMLIDGIGTVTAERIVTYRNMYGYFSDYSQLLNVDGIGKKKLENLMDYIYISEEWLDVRNDDVTDFSEATIVTSVPDNKKNNHETTLTKATASTEDIVIVNEEFVFDDYDETENITTEKYVNFPLELNTATVDELMCIDGIGEYIAQNIVNYARQYGFYSVDDLLNVDGIGRSKMELIVPYVYADSFMLPPKEETVYQESETITESIIYRVNINTCSKSELIQIPDIDESMADRIISFRKEVGGFLKIEELMLVEGMTNEKMLTISAYIYI